MLHTPKNTAEHNATDKASIPCGSVIYNLKLVWAAAITVLLLGSPLYYNGEVGLWKNNVMRLWDLGFTKEEQQIVRRYHLQTGARWMNPGVNFYLPRPASYITDHSCRWGPMESDVCVQWKIALSNLDS